MSAFVAPTSLEGSSVKLADLNGHLCIFKPTAYKENIETTLGKAEAIECDVIDVDTATEHKSVLFFNVAVRSALKPNIGKQVLARVGQGVAKPGKSAPWILVNALDNQADVAKATAFLTAVVAPATSQAAPTPPANAEITPEIAALLAKLGATQV